MKKIKFIAKIIYLENTPYAMLDTKWTNIQNSGGCTSRDWL